MVKSSAATPEDYLSELAPDRASDISRVRDRINSALQPGFAEHMAWGMISWDVPLDVSGPTYNKQPLQYAALAAQKNYNALYLNCVYGSDERTERLRSAFEKSGKTLDMGKACIRFRNADELDLDAIERELAERSPTEFAEAAKAARDR